MCLKTLFRFIVVVVVVVMMMVVMMMVVMMINLYRCKNKHSKSPASPRLGFALLPGKIISSFVKPRAPEGMYRSCCHLSCVTP